MIYLIKKCLGGKEEKMENEKIKIKTCRYAFAHLINYICLKCNHKITKDDCEECKDYSNKYYMTKEKTMQYKEK